LSAIKKRNERQGRDGTCSKEQVKLCVKRQNIHLFRGGEELSPKRDLLLQERFDGVKRTAFCVLILTFLLLTPPVLRAETPKDAPAPVSGKQARLSDDSGQSSTMAAVTTYDQLVAAVRKARSASQARVEKAVEQERVREAWEIGQLIDAHVLQHKERADYGKQVLKRLADDLGMSETELRYMLQFARTYPIHRPADELSWSQYQSLLAVNDPEERKTLAAKAVKEKWNRDKTREEVKKVKARKGTGSLAGGTVPVSLEEPETLKPLPLGQPGTYRIILAQAGSYAGELALDLGFSVSFRLSEIAEDLSPFHEGDLVSFEDKEMQLLGKPRGTHIEDLLYTYKARVLRVLDGDTLEAVIDLGFGVATTQTLRLRGIDCPELVSKDGKEAKEFVENLLIGDSVEGLGDRKTKTEPVIAPVRQGISGGSPSGKPVIASGAKQSILIKTSKSDKYDRYLVDVFYEDKTGESQYLNNVLLQKGLAVRAGE
jgi:endonuclease YncB( thermonuclease family)